MKVALHDHNYAASSVHRVVAAVRPCAENCVEISRLKQAKLSLNVTSRKEC